MPKSKEFVSSDSDASSGSEDSEPKTKKVKKDKKEKKKEKSEASGSGGPGGEVSFQLAKMRYVSVSEFRGKKYVNIREYYEKDGQTLPGRKGIALNEDQWAKLKKCSKEIDQALEDM